MQPCVKRVPYSLDDAIIVNGQRVFLDRSLSCKSKNMVYLTQFIVCKIRQSCLSKESDIDPNEIYIEDAYIGQTVSEVRTRMRAHRSSFKVDKDGRTPHAKSALAQHCFNEHPDKMELSVFKTRLISKLRTEIMGLNIIKVII